MLQLHLPEKVLENLFSAAQNNKSAAQFQHFLKRILNQMNALVGDKPGYNANHWLTVVFPLHFFQQICFAGFLSGSTFDLIVFFDVRVCFGIVQIHINSVQNTTNTILSANQFPIHSIREPRV